MAAVVPACLDWSVEKVGDWIESIGFPQYRVSRVDSRWRQVLHRSLSGMFRGQRGERSEAGVGDWFHAAQNGYHRLEPYTS